MTGTDSKETHVHFASIDPEVEEERSARGQQLRKDLVRGIRWHQETEKTIRVVQMKDGHDFIKGLKDFATLCKQSLGVKLTIQGFLAVFNEKFSDDPDTEDLEAHFKFFHESTLPVEKYGSKLQEHLILIALQTAEDGYYRLPDAASLGESCADSDEPEIKKLLLDKP